MDTCSLCASRTSLFVRHTTTNAAKFRRMMRSAKRNLGMLPGSRTMRNMRTCDVVLLGSGGVMEGPRRMILSVAEE